MFYIYKRSYVMIYDAIVESITIISKKDNKVIQFGIDSAIDSLDEKERLTSIQMKSQSDDGFIFTIHSLLWKNKEVQIQCFDDAIHYFVTIEGEGQAIDRVNFLLNRDSTSTTGFDCVYVPRFDWKEGKVIVPTSAQESLGCQQWLSPPPFCYGLKADNEVVAVGIAAAPNTSNFISFDYVGDHDENHYSLTYEGHTCVSRTFTTPTLLFLFGYEEENQAVKGYIKYLRDTGFLPKLSEKKLPDWWSEPIFCGWGEMRYEYRLDHDFGENGTFINVTRYANESVYRNYIDELEQHGVNPGTIIIDMGWADEPGLWRPSKRRWIDMRKFIDEQHEIGRKVLLWYTPVVTSGFPLEACMTLNNEPVAPDPSNPLYKEIMKEQIFRMLSSEEGCLNADGFKIDFTQNTPSENGRFRNYLTSFWGLIQDDQGTPNKYVYPELMERPNQELIKTFAPIWGVEVLRAYIEVIYSTMKQVKEDSVLITHTANPYFADIVDILRLNDLDGDCDNVLEIMTNRFEIAKACNPNWLIDTDNDLMYDKEKWRAYIQLQPQLGIPDTYYITGIATSMEKFTSDDYDLLNLVWNNYRKNKM